MAINTSNKDIVININCMKKNLRKADGQKKFEAKVDEHTKFKVIIKYQQHVRKVDYWKKLAQVGAVLYILLLILVPFTAFYKPLEGLNKALGNVGGVGVMVYYTLYVVDEFVPDIYKRYLLSSQV